MEGVTNFSAIDIDNPLDSSVNHEEHFYGPAAIYRWIEMQNIEQPQTEIQNINESTGDDNVKTMDVTNTTTCSTNYHHKSRLSMTAMPMIQPVNMMFPQASGWHSYWNRCRATTEKIKTKSWFLVVTIIFSSIIALLSIGALTVFFAIRVNSNNHNPTVHGYPLNNTYSPTVYKFPNQCSFKDIKVIFSWSNVFSFNYTYFSKSFKSVVNRSMITFAFRHDHSYWCIDDLSAKDIRSNKELVENGNFESSLSNYDNFRRCDINGIISNNRWTPGSDMHGGPFSFCDGRTAAPRYLSHQLQTEIEHIYIVSFWLKNLGNGNNGATVVLSAASEMEVDSKQFSETFK